MTPHGLFFVLGFLSNDRWGQIFPKWPPPENYTLMNIPKTFASNVLPPQQATVTPCFPKRSSKNCSQVLPRFLWRFCFPPGPSAHESLCAPFKNRVSVFPSSMELLHTSPTGPQCQMFQDSSSQCQIPRRGSPMWGLELSLPW